MLILKWLEDTCYNYLIRVSKVYPPLCPHLPLWFLLFYLLSYLLFYFLLHLTSPLGGAVSGFTIDKQKWKIKGLTPE